MLILMMFLCALGAILLIGLLAFSEMHNLWVHPQHRSGTEGWRHIHDGWRHNHPHH